jgi:hypothetical protein
MFIGHKLKDERRAIGRPVDDPRPSSAPTGRSGRLHGGTLSRVLRHSRICINKFMCSTWPMFHCIRRVVVKSSKRNFTTSNFRWRCLQPTRTSAKIDAGEDSLRVNKPRTQGGGREVACRSGPDVVIRSNVVEVQSWACVPGGDVVKDWRPDILLKSSREATPVQREEEM